MRRLPLSGSSIFSALRAIGSQDFFKRSKELSVSHNDFFNSPLILPASSPFFFQPSVSFRDCLPEDSAPLTFFPRTFQSRYSLDLIKALPPCDLVRFFFCSTAEDPSFRFSIILVPLRLFRYLFLAPSKSFPLP